MLLFAERESGSALSRFSLGILAEYDCGECMNEATTAKDAIGANGDAGAQN